MIPFGKRKAYRHHLATELPYELAHGVEGRRRQMQHATT